VRLGGAHLLWEGPTQHIKAYDKGLGVRGAQIPLGREVKCEGEVS
jgi:hypothetical protein